LGDIDHECNGVASGVAARYALVDVSPEECGSDTPPAACNTAEYSGPFTLPSGTHNFTTALRIMWGTGWNLEAPALL